MSAVRSVSRRAIVLGGAAVLVAGTARADDGLDAALGKIARARASVRTLRGPFTQIRTIGLLATDVRSRGTVALVRPDRLRWQLDPPDDVTFWIGPEGIGYRSADGQGRTAPANARMAQALDDLRTMLGGDLVRLRDRWRMRVRRDDPTGIEIQADPREGAPAGLHSMQFALGPDLVRPTHVLLVEGPHDRTAIDFGDLVVNAPIDESSMRLP